MSGKILQKIIVSTNRGSVDLYGDAVLVRSIKGAEAIAHAFRAVHPTQRLIEQCHTALAKAKVKPLTPPKAV